MNNEVISVLIVAEKDIDVRNMRRVLIEQGYNITGIYASCQETVLSIKKDNPNLVMMCSALHDSKNIKLAQQIKSQICIPIIYVYFSGDKILQCTNASNCSAGYIVKPYSAETLQSNIENGIRQHFHDDKKSKYNSQPLNSPSIRVLLADERQIVLWGLERLIAGEKPQMEIIGTASNAADTIRLTKETQPDILLLHIHLDDEDCAHLIPNLVKNGHTRVIIYAKACDLEVSERVALSGASGVVYENSSTQAILKAIEKIHAGEIWFDRRTASRILNCYLLLNKNNPVNLEAEKIATLTRKERAVVNAFAQADGGAQNKHLAAALCISNHTLRNHLTSIFNKLEITNRYDLFMFAKRYFSSSNLANTLPETSKDNG